MARPDGQIGTCKHVILGCSKCTAERYRLRAANADCDRYRDALTELVEAVTAQRLDPTTSEDAALDRARALLSKEGGRGMTADPTVRSP